jgi:hypothetical protein
MATLFERTRNGKTTKCEINEYGDILFFVDGKRINPEVGENFTVQNTENVTDEKLRQMLNEHGCTGIWGERVGLYDDEPKRIRESSEAARKSAAETRYTPAQRRAINDAMTEGHGGQY